MSPPPGVEADAWARPGTPRDRAGKFELWEHPMALPEYETVLTLLWQRHA